MLMKPRSFADMRGPVAGAVEVVVDRWTLLLMRDLSLGLSRYDAFRASTGIPAATLASRLRHLTDHGIVERVRYQERPARDAYRLTEKGRALWRVSMALRERSEEHTSELPSLMRISYAVLCWKKTTQQRN